MSSTTPEQQPKWKRSLQISQLVAGVVVAAASATVALYSSVRDRYSLQFKDFAARAEIERLTVDTVKARAALDQRRQELDQQLQSLSAMLARLQTEVAAPRSGTPSAKFTQQVAEARAAIAEVESRVDVVAKRSSSIDERMSKLEAAILQNPERAVEIPLLKRDIKALQDQFGSDLNSLRAESGRMYDLMKWLVGLMAIVSLSLVGTAVGNLFKREATPRAATEEKPKPTTEPSA